EQFSPRHSRRPDLRRLHDAVIPLNTHEVSRHAQRELSAGTSLAMASCRRAGHSRRPNRGKKRGSRAEGRTPMRSRKAAIAALLSLIVITNVICIRANEGRIPVFAPGALTAPGRYQVTGNLAVGGGSVLTIASDDVDLDLNGFTLSSTAIAPVISA